MPQRPSASQSLQETNNQFSSESTKHLFGHTSENFSSRKGDEVICKDSFIKQSIVCGGQEPSTESCNDQCVYIDSSTQTCDLLKTNKGLQAPVQASCTDVNESDSHSIKFTVQLPGGVNNKSKGTNLPQQQTASSNSGALFTVSQPRTQTRALGDSKQPSSISIASSKYEVDHLQISPENKSTGGCSLLGSLRLDEDVSSEIAQYEGTGLSSKYSTGVNNSDRRAIGVGGDAVGDEPSKTKPQNRDNVQWIAMPSSRTSGTAVKEEQTDFCSKKLPTIALTSSEKPGVIYKAIPLESLLQTGMSYFHISLCIVTTVLYFDTLLY